MNDAADLLPNERIKAESSGLRGTLAASLADPLTGALADNDTQVIKFHGIYQQDDRDLRIERQLQKLEPRYSFMLRARAPGGVIATSQWLELDQIARRYSHQVAIRLTTRQTFQYHGIAKRELRDLVRMLHATGLDSNAACGDVNRNVICTSLPADARIHGQLVALSRELSERFLPRSGAYHEIWLDDAPVPIAPVVADEPLYGPTYLPRKFKIAIAAPPDNDVDLYANDLAFAAIFEGGIIEGCNVLVGGGMGATPQDPTTYPRLATDLGYAPMAALVTVAEAVLTTQRDWGNRSNRRRARLKYTIDTHGLAPFRAEVERRAGIRFAPPRPVVFTHNADRIGWTETTDGRAHLCLFVEHGRLAGRLLDGARALAEVHDGEFRLTANQNLIVAGVRGSARARIEAIARGHGLAVASPGAIRGRSAACVALPTCGLAMAEAERYLPTLVGRLEALAARYGLTEVPIVTRMSGCPNGCSRPYLAEIGLVGQAPGRYNLHLGGDARGARLAPLYRSQINEAEVLAALEPLFARFAAERQPSERFGDALWRLGVVTEQPVGGTHGC
jgi:sulfite reductase (NADPH) hemoprotein beta-component